MIFDQLKKAFEEFKERFPEITERLNDPEQAGEIKKITSALKKFKGRRLLDIPSEEKSLKISGKYYDWNHCIKEGMFVAGHKKNDADSVPRVHIRGIDFFNPDVAAEHLAVLEKRQSLEEILKEDPDFKTKLTVVFDESWRNFLSKSGYEVDYFSKFDSQEFVKQESYLKSALLHPLLKDRVNAAYELITKRAEEVSSRKARFAAEFPDFAEVIKDLNMYRHRELIDRRGWWFKRDFKELDSSDILDYKDPGEVVEDKLAKKAVALRDRIKNATFKKYDDLIKDNPEIKEQIEYIKEHKDLLLPADYQRINLQNVLGMPKLRLVTRGFGRRARSYRRPSNKQYDERIVDTVNHLYELVQKREKEPQKERPIHQQERLKRWSIRGKKTEKIARFVDHVLEKTKEQNWYEDFQRLVNGFRFPGDYRINRDPHWSRQNIGFYVSAGQIKREWGWNTLVSGSEERFDTPGIILRQLREHKEEERYLPVAKKFEELVNECVAEYFKPETT